MPFTPAEKRWQRFEASHGDMLRKLPKSDQRMIRDLVNRNDSRDARHMTNELDNERRTRERVRSKLRRIREKPPEERKGTNPFSGASDLEIQILRKMAGRRKSG